MRRLFFACAIALSCLVHADQTKLGLYLMGSRIGLSTYASSNDTLDGKSVRRTDSVTDMDAALLGQDVKIRINSSSWTDLAGRPMKMTFHMESAGRTQDIEATFSAKTAKVNVDNSGTKSVKSLAIPQGAPIVDDPLTEMLAEKAKPGAVKAFYVLDPTTVSFIKNTAQLKGAAEADVFGKKIPAQLIEIVDPRATMRVFVRPNGELVKVDGPMGMEMIPETDAEAANPPPTTPIDLATMSSIKTDPEIEDPDHLTELRIFVTGHDLSKIPSDEHQSVKKEGDGWIVDVHPPLLSQSPDEPIAQAGAEKRSWTLPSLDIPSDSGTFRSLARQIVGKRDRVREAALAIKNYVHSIMHPNAGIGVVRNANDVLKTKEGVCRDYAILTTTLLRAAGIPSRVASGLESFDGRFYYHAWSEAWDGKRWIGIDSTVPEQQISAGHVKLASGSVEDAFTFAVLDKVKVKVLAQKHSAKG